jgi:nucleoside-diphosphate-sugar epimerase
MKVALIGGGGDLGRRLAARLLAGGHEVVAVDRQPSPQAVAGVLPVVLDVATAPIEPALSGCDAVVHLEPVFAADAVSRDESAALIGVAQRVLGAAAAAGVHHVVLLSTAMVYGAWPNNPIPLTEDAPVRPNPEFVFAVHHAELERRGSEWRDDGPDRVLSVLRPAAVVADERPSRVARLLRSVGTVRASEGDAPAQYVHIDDLAAAIVTVLEHRATGAFNVAPDGWIAPEALGALAYPGPRPLVPGWAAQAWARLRWRLGLAAAPPGLVPFTIYPWVVANDRLRALGWRPADTNEEAFVIGHTPTPFDKLTSRRRQQLALGISGGVLASVVGGAVGTVLWRRRVRTRSGSGRS